MVNRQSYYWGVDNRHQSSEPPTMTMTPSASPVTLPGGVNLNRFYPGRSPAAYLEPDLTLRLIKLARSLGYSYGQTAEICLHVKSFASAQLCPAITDESHRDLFDAALPGSWARWAERARRRCDRWATETQKGGDR
jgi:hypothetical protein